MSKLLQAIENLVAHIASVSPETGAAVQSSVDEVKAEAVATEQAAAAGVTNAAEAATDGALNSALGVAAPVVEIPAHVLITTGVNWLLSFLGVKNVAVPLSAPVTPPPPAA